MGPVSAPQSDWLNSTLSLGLCAAHAADEKLGQAFDRQRKWQRTSLWCWAGLLCGIDCRCVDAEELLCSTPPFWFALHDVVHIFIQLWYADETFIYCVIYSFTLCALRQKLEKEPAAWSAGLAIWSAPALVLTDDLVPPPPVELRMSVCLGGLVPVWPALLSTVCVFTLLSNGRRQMLVAAHDLQMSYMATELESADNASA